MLNENKILHELKQIRKENLLQKPIWNLKDLLLFTGYSESWAYKAVMNREIPFIKKRNRLFFDSEKIITWIKEDSIDSDANELKLFQDKYK